MHSISERLSSKQMLILLGTLPVLEKNCGSFTLVGPLVKCQHNIAIFI